MTDQTNDELRKAKHADLRGRIQEALRVYVDDDGADDMDKVWAWNVLSDFDDLIAMLERVIEGQREERLAQTSDRHRQPTAEEAVAALQHPGVTT